MLHAQSCPTLHNPMDRSLPGSSVHGISQASILEWLPFPFPEDFPDPGIEPRSPVSPALAGGSFTTEPPGKPIDGMYLTIINSIEFSPSIHRELVPGPTTVCVLVSQSCPTLCNPMDCSLPGSSIHGILQARILEWIAISFSRGSSQPRD